MQDISSDPRVLRTRRLIMDAFIELSGKEDFQDITVKDLTTLAAVNRATLYRHFEDKYDLLEKALEEVLHISLPSEYHAAKEFNENTLVTIFVAVTEFQKTISLRCHDGYEEKIAKIIRDQLEVIFQKQLLRIKPTNPEPELKSLSSFLAWGIYGASVDWRKLKHRSHPEEYLKPLLPYLLQGLKHN